MSAYDEDALRAAAALPALSERDILEANEPEFDAPVLDDAGQPVTDVAALTWLVNATRHYALRLFAGQAELLQERNRAEGIARDLVRWDGVTNIEERDDRLRILIAQAGDVPRRDPIANACIVPARKPTNPKD